MPIDLSVEGISLNKGSQGSKVMFSESFESSALPQLVFDCLKLTRSGTWLWNQNPVVDAVFLAKIQENYHCDTLGRWYVQNGNQTLFVDLDYTPWILTFAENGALTTHTNQPIKYLKSVWLDEHGSMLMETELGVGVLTDTSYGYAKKQLCTKTGSMLRKNPLDAKLAVSGQPSKPKFFFKRNQRLVPVGWIHSKSVSYKFHFVDHPSACLSG